MNSKLGRIKKSEKWYTGKHSEMSDTSWQFQKKNYLERGKYLLETGIWSDCTFIVGNDQIKKEFRLHKLILSMASPVFEKMFYGEVLSTQENEIKVTDCQSDAFGTMLNYIYTEEMKTESFDEVIDVYYIANKYMLPHLMNRCTTFLKNGITVRNACFGFEFAKLFEEQEIMDKCKELILKDTTSIVTLANFTAVNISTVKMILRESSLNISELNLFKAVERWIRTKFESEGISGMQYLEQQRQLCAEIIPNICFLNMTPKEFAEGPAISNFLTKDEAFAILMNISSPNCGYAMPNGFTKMIRKNITWLR